MERTVVLSADGLYQLCNNPSTMADSRFMELEFICRTFVTSSPDRVRNSEATFCSHHPLFCMSGNIQGISRVSLTFQGLSVHILK